MQALADDAFRREVGDRIEADHPPDTVRHPSRRLFQRENRDWFMRLSAQGWIAPGWPRAQGGTGLSGPRRLIVIEEIERFGAARVNDQRLVTLGSLLIRYRSAAQQACILPGGHDWAQARRHRARSRPRTT